MFTRHFLLSKTTPREFSFSTLFLYRTPPNLNFHNKTISKLHGIGPLPPFRNLLIKYSKKYFPQYQIESSFESYFPVYEMQLTFQDQYNFHSSYKINILHTYPIINTPKRQPYKKTEPIHIQHPHTNISSFFKTLYYRLFKLKWAVPRDTIVYPTNTYNTTTTTLTIVGKNTYIYTNISKQKIKLINMGSYIWEIKNKNNK